ncbi:MAG: hypothetical protein ACWGQW_02370 [bacterium]
MNGNEAGIVIQALEGWITETRERGDRLLVSPVAQAGANCHRDADIAEALMNRLDETFPDVYSE